MKKVITATIIIILIIVSITIYLVDTNLRISKIKETAEEIKIGDEIYIKDNRYIDNSTIGYLTIPKIELLNIEVRESVEEDILEQYIGHFDSTNIYEGNIGLASHNRGSEAVFFEDVHKLKIGDEIYFETPYGNRKYKVSIIREIEDANWEYLNKTEDNRITMITCVKNQPNLRLCVQGVEIK